MRHVKLDDKHIPDFAATRAADGFTDFIEVKQPFLKCFTLSGFSSEFNTAWNQAASYATFCIEHAAYLRTAKSMTFDKPQCVLLMGQQLSSEQIDKIRRRQMDSSYVKFMSYDQLLRQAKHILESYEAAVRAPDNDSYFLEVSQTAE